MYILISPIRRQKSTILSKKQIAPSPWKNPEVDNHLSSSLRQSTRRSHTDLKTMDSETCRAAFFSHSFKSTYKVVDDCREEEPERKQRPAYLHLSKKHLKGSDVLSETVAHTKSAYPIKHCGNLKGGEGLLLRFVLVTFVKKTAK